MSVKRNMSEKLVLQIIMAFLWRQKSLFLYFEEFSSFKQKIDVDHVFDLQPTMGFFQIISRHRFLFRILLDLNRIVKFMEQKHVFTFNYRKTTNTYQACIRCTRCMHAEFVFVTT